MNRRTLIKAATGSLAAPMTVIAGADSALPSSGSLQPTRLIDCQHPAITQLAIQLCEGAGSDREKAVRIHDAVRDRVRFGLAPAFYDMKASEVLAAGVGYCNSKTTLFSALLRASGLPTRTRMVDLDAGVLRGLFSPGTDTVDHAIAEVYFDDRWNPVDSYVVDMALEAAARNRLAREARPVGYGIHEDGTSRWDGRSPSFIQAVPGTSTAARIVRVWGTFNDVEEFYRTTPGARNRLNLLTSVLIRLGAPSINRNIDNIRSAAQPKPLA